MTLADAPAIYREHVLAEPMIALAIAAITPDAPRSTWRAYSQAMSDAERAVRRISLPSSPPCPPLRWVCRPPDYDPAWTVNDLLASYGTHRRGWFRLGAAFYHPTTGRSSSGRATFHGRLWSPQDQVDAWSAWINACAEPAKQRDAQIVRARLEHRAAVVTRITWPVEIYHLRDEPRRTLSLYRLFTAEHVATVEPAYLRPVLAQRPWFSPSRWEAGEPHWFSDGDVKAFLARIPSAPMFTP